MPGARASTRLEPMDRSVTDGAEVLRETSDVAGRLLRFAATFFAFVVLFHNSDHARRGGTSVTTDVFWIGSLAILLEVGVVVLVFMGHHDAPSASLVTGIALALGYVVVHFTPDRGWLSDSFVSGSPALISRVAAGLEVTGALTLAAAGWSAMRRPPAAATRSDRSPAEALRHPVVALMALGNLAIFALAVLGRYA
jgi:hypothetical protein